MGERMRCRVVERGYDYAKCVLWYEDETEEVMDGERVVARRKSHHILGESLDWEPDPDAPSIDDLRQGMTEVRDMLAANIGYSRQDMIARLDRLIARLEGE